MKKDELNEVRTESGIILPPDYDKPIATPVDMDVLARRAESRSKAAEQVRWVEPSPDVLTPVQARRKAQRRKAEKAAKKARKRNR